MKKLLIALATAAALAGCGSSGTGWYVSPTGNDSGSCTKDQPCKTFNGAAAKAGKDPIIHVLPGAYPSQTVNTGSSGDCASRYTDGQTANCRTFLATDGNVTIGGLKMDGAGTALLGQPTKDSQGRITGSNVKISGAYGYGFREWVLKGVDVDPANGDPGVYIDHATDFVLSESQVHGVVDNDGIDVYGGATGNLRVRLLQNYVHDVKITASSCQHTDGIQVAGTTGPGNTGTVIRGNTIDDIDQNAAIQLDTATSQVGTGEVIENNVFGAIHATKTSCVPSPSPRALNVSGHQLTVRGNVSNQGAPFLVYPGTGTVSGNTVPLTSGNCSSYSWSNNVYTQQPKPSWATNC